jgi:hypothetical protein
VHNADGVPDDDPYDFRAAPAVTGSLDSLNPFPKQETTAASINYTIRGSQASATLGSLTAAVAATAVAATESSKQQQKPQQQAASSNNNNINRRACSKQHRHSGIRTVARDSPGYIELLKKGENRIGRTREAEAGRYEGRQGPPYLFWFW